ncbi:MAG: hypothetical protein IKH61_15425 [Bacteroidales bacterium]|nr:hypothetical protein [Bacteroidales bacterium]
MKFDEIFSICKQIQFEMKAENVQYGNEKPLGNTNSNQGFNRYAYCMYNPKSNYIMFDYLVYRMYMAYEKKHKGNVNSLWLASLGLVVFQILIIYSIAFFVYFFSNKTLFVEFHIKSFFLKVVVGGICVLLAFLYYWHYQKKLDSMIKKYKNRRVHLKDWMLIIIAIMLVFSPVLWNWLYKLLV